MAASNFDEVTYALQTPPTINILRNTNSLGPLGANAVSTVAGTWSGFCSLGSATNITYNTTDIAAPDGSYTATKIVRDNVASCGANSVAWGITTSATSVFVAGQTYTTSVWIRTLGPPITNMTFGGNDYYTSTVTATSGWQRFSRTFTPSGAVNTLDRGFEVYTSAVNVTYYVWGAQTEEGATATPYQGWNPGTNIALSSQQFENNTYWAKSNSSISADVTVAPDGSVTGDKLVESVSTSEHTMYYNAAAGSQATNVTRTFSVYAKAGERSQIVLSFSNFVNSDARVFFNLNTGTLFSTTTNSFDYSNVSGTITGVGNGWYRCSITATKAAYNTNNYPNILLYNGSVTSYTGDGTSGAYLWGAQIESGSAMTAYRVTTTVNLVPSTQTFLRENASAVYTTGTLDEITYNQSAPAIVNLIQYSQSLDNAIYWGYTGSNATGNVAIAPDGTLTATKIVGGVGVSSRKSVYQYPPTFVAGQTYTYSVYLKTAGITTATIWLDTVNTSPSAYWGAGALINLIDGSVGGAQPQATSTTAVGNGWYRCQVTGTFTVGGVQAVQIAMGSANGGATQVGNGVDGIFVWGAQLEVDAAPSVYQPKTVNAIVAPSFRRRITNNGPVYVTSSFDEWTGVPTTEGLVYWYDAGQSASYPGSGTAWIDLSTAANPNFGGFGSGGFPQFNYVTPSFTVSPTRGMRSGNPTAATNTTSFTLEAWVLHTSFAAGDKYNNFISIREQYLTRGYRFGVGTPSGLGTDTTGCPIFWTDQSGGNINGSYPSYPISLNTWYQVCVTYDISSSTCRVWFNGALLSTQTNATFVPPVSSNELFIGGAASGCNSLLGSIAIFKQYNYALSAGEIAQNFTAVRGRFGI